MKIIKQSTTDERRLATSVRVELTYFDIAKRSTIELRSNICFLDYRDKKHRNSTKK